MGMSVFDSLKLRQCRGIPSVLSTNEFWITMLSERYVSQPSEFAILTPSVLWEGSGPIFRLSHP